MKKMFFRQTMKIPRFANEKNAADWFDFGFHDGFAFLRGTSGNFAGLMMFSFFVKMFIFLILVIDFLYNSQRSDKT
jgi:hypothetical protein